MVERGIFHIEEDRFLAKVKDGIIRLHRHDNDHVLRSLDFYLVNAFKPPFGDEDTVFCYFCSHGTLLDRGFRVSILPHKTVEKRLLTLDHELTRDRLQQIANYLTTEFRGLNLDELTASARDSADEESETHRDTLERQAFEIIRGLVPKANPRAEVQVAGTENLLRTEDFTEIERVRSLFATLDDEQRIVQEIRRALASRSTEVIIGRESALTASGELGMVTTLFYRNGQRAGAVGVVGPRRMDYARIVPVVEFIGDSLTKMLQEPGAMNG